MKPIVQDQYTSARAYLLCAVGLVLAESVFRVPFFFYTRSRRGTPSSERPSHGRLYVYLHKLQTLPSPFPSFITDHRAFDLFRLAAFIGLNVLWGWNKNVYASDYARYGWLTIANGGLTLLLAPRNSLWQSVARIPSDTVLMFHRWAGRATVVNATIHFSGIYTVYARVGQGYTIVLNRRIQVGLMTWSTLIIILVTSCRIIRRRWFEVFYYTHFLFIIFAVGATVHASNGPEFILPGLILWVLDRLVRFYYNFRTISVEKIEHFAGDVTKISFRGIRRPLPGQAVWIQIPSVSFLDWHPFTVLSGQGDERTIAVRGLGGYTKQLYKTAEQVLDVSLEKGMSPLKMRVDGPYRVSRTAWGVYPLNLIVAGGIGITPGISLIDHFFHMARESTAEDPPTWQIKLLWIVREREHAKCFAEELANFAKLASDPACGVSLDVLIHVTSARSDTFREVSGFDSVEILQEQHSNVYALTRHGRPDLRHWMRTATLSSGTDAALLACGPQSLVRAVRVAASQASGSDGLIHVEAEAFDL